MPSYSVSKQISRRDQRQSRTRFLVTQQRENGRSATWELSPTALRALIDQFEDALEAHESEKTNAGNNRSQ